ncbi:MAG: aldo/keto reductase [Candidatus Cohnella colombiensis]|uniref:Aldo/keto reductase n=1 Tax=Candidatus Cohnella colombiensis TaxID=3121368 RepID=A0AA95EUL8_9BACL|nr:MAG: aldo/keto reductase [Cohnella sp.]
MKMNRLGSSDLNVSEIALGCMSIGTEEQKAISLIHEALHHGVNLLDTADLYDDGRNEELVGKAIKGRRNQIVLSTKVGNRLIPGQEGWVWDPSKRYIKEAVELSLRRLQTGYIDFYQLHGGTIDDPIDETIEAFEELKQAGLIRHYGISSIRPNVIREYVARSSIVGVMNQISILDRRAEEEVLPLLQERDIGVLARGPIAKGILVEDRIVTNNYLDYSVEELLDLRAELKALVTPDRSLSQLAIRYTLSHPAVATAVVGASSSEQLLHNVRAADVPPLTPDEIDSIRQLSLANRYESHR